MCPVRELPGPSMAQSMQPGDEDEGEDDEDDYDDDDDDDDDLQLVSSLTRVTSVKPLLRLTSSK